MIRASEAVPKPTHSYLSELFGVGRTTVGGILKKKKLYEEEWKKNKNSKRCRISKFSSTDALNDKIYVYYTQAKLKKYPLSGPILQAKALEIAKALDIKDFKASNGWLESWKKKFNIKNFRGFYKEKILDEKDIALVGDYKLWLPNLTMGYKPENVFACDEVSLFYKCLPEMSLEQKFKLVKNGELKKERLTILLCCNSNGDKLKPLVIGETDFSNININKENLPVKWLRDEKSLMTSKHFTEWLKITNTEMMSQNRKILLFMDSAPSHVASRISLSHINILFTPSISCLQPIDSSLKNFFKTNYRKRLMHYFIVNFGQFSSFTDIINQIHIIQVFSWIACSWKEVSVDAIKRSFHQCGFEADLENEGELSNYDSLQHLLDSASLCGLPVHLLASEYISIDDNLPTESCRNEITLYDNTSNTEDENNTIPSHSEAFHYLNKLLVYFGCRDPECSNLIDIFTQMVTKNYLFEKQSIIQSELHETFSL